MMESPLDHFEGDRRSSSPKRKKIRQKYAPKACVSCRRSKLKCSGENPCQRCKDNGKRCFFSEDQTAAEALQNLSRPTPSQPPLPTIPNGNNVVPSAQPLAPLQGLERRQSTVSTADTTLEARMTRIEAMMDALMRNQGMLMTPMGNVDREGSEGMPSQASSVMPHFESLQPALTHMEHQPTFALEQSTWAQPSSAPDHPARGSDAHRILYLEDRLLPVTFPSNRECDRYLHSFFSDIHLRYPCIDEITFREGSKNLLENADRGIQIAHFPLLALHYVLFACCEVLLETTPSSGSPAPAGWHWLQLSQSLIGGNDLPSSAQNLTLLQILFFQALYCSFADMPKPAYRCIEQASGLVIKLATTLSPEVDLETKYMRACLFSATFVWDRLIALSCGLPYHITESDIEPKLWTEVINNVISTESNDKSEDEMETPSNRHRPYFCRYMQYMVLWARFLGDDSIEPDLHGQAREHIDYGIRSFLESELSQLQVPYHSPNENTPSCPHKIFMLQVRINLLLKGFRAELLNLSYDNEKATSFLWLATSTVNQMRSFSCAARSFRHQIVTSLAGALLVFCSLLVRGAQNYGGFPHEQRESCKQSFRDTVAMLIDLAYGLPYARRVHRDFAQIISTVKEIINETTDPLLLLNNVAEIFPYRNTEKDSGRKDEREADLSGCKALWYY